MYTYNCTMVRWIDGDTAVLTIDLGFRMSFTDNIRVYGINAPELHSPDPVVRKAAQDALAYARQIAPEGKVYQITSYKDPQDKFGRWLATIALSDGSDFSTLMVSSGHAVVYKP